MSKIVTVAVAAVIFSAASVQAQTPAEFFKGKTVTYIVATSPGGGYDTYGRLISRYMPKYVVGAKFVVKNVPGAGHIVGANTIYAAKPDGLTVGSFNTGLIFAQLLKDEGIKFDLAKMSWIGKASSDPRALVLTKNSGLKDLAGLIDAGKPAHKLAAAGLGSSSYIDMKLVAEALRLNVELIPGFNGNEGEMSMLRNEVVGTLGSLSSLQPFVENGNGFFALQIGGKATAGVPDGMAMVEDDRGKQLMSLVAAEGVIGRLTAGPPEIPADRLDYLRSSYLKTLVDAEFLTEAKKLDVPVEPADGPTTEKIVKDGLNQTPDTIKLLAAIVNAK
jgi:tripartite-type tricarboxylate transporter receptor subunit TctC